MVKSYVQVLGTRTDDTTPSLLLFFDQKRFLFNVGDGTQRLCTELKVKLPKINNVFLSNLSPESVGGLPGALLTMADTNHNGLTLHGPTGLSFFLYAARRFYNRRSFPVKVEEVTSSNVIHSDEYCTVFGIPSMHAYDPGSNIRTQSQRQIEEIVKLRVRKEEESRNSSCQHSANPKYSERELDVPIVDSASEFPVTSGGERVGSGSGGGSDSRRFDAETSNAEHSKKRKVCQSDATDGDASTTKPMTGTSFPKTDAPNGIWKCTYVVTLADQKGKFRPDKAIDLGVPKGKLFGQLQNGQSVTTKEGKEVHPAQVMDPPVPGKRFAVVDVASPSCLDDVRKEMSVYIDNDHENRFEFMFHLGDDRTIKLPEYVRFIESFPKKIKHIFFSESTCPQRVAFCGAYENQLKLSHLDEHIFPPPRPESQGSGDALPIPDGIPADIMMKAILSPQANVGISTDKSEVDLSTSVIGAKVKEELSSLTKWKEAVDVWKRTKREETTTGGMCLPTITFLGTGAAIPSKYRNVSAIYLDIEGEGMLMDCGEGCYGQLRRRFGDDTDKIIMNLSAIWVSHMHADHHLGINAILWRRQKLSQQHKLSLPDVLVIGPIDMCAWLVDYQKLCPLSFEFENAKWCNDRSTELAKWQQLQRLGIRALSTVEVDHCYDAYGLRVDHNRGWSIVYSGDTRPCESLIELGQNCTLLIHEATFESEMKEEAVSKKHCTVAEAMCVGQRMRAKNVLLTHFSQRYPKFPTVANESNFDFCIAFDFMTINWVMMSNVRALLPAFEELFPPETKNEDDMSDAVKRKKVKQERAVKWNQRNV